MRFETHKASKASPPSPHTIRTDVPGNGPKSIVESMGCGRQLRCSASGSSALAQKTLVYQWPAQALAPALCWHCRSGSGAAPERLSGRLSGRCWMFSRTVCGRLLSAPFRNKSGTTTVPLEAKQAIDKKVVFIVATPPRFH
jgi:hypothetical protein